MLIQITNKCFEDCAHCMQCSNPDGKHMSLQTFKAALRFADFLKSQTLIISGGEPTEHPEFEEICNIANRFCLSKNTSPQVFSVCSNGMWFKDSDKQEMVYRLSRLKAYAGMQVYTNAKWYKNSAYILKNEKEINAIPKVVVDTTDIQSMQDLGRAKTNVLAQMEIDRNSYNMSCLNGHLVFKQLNPNRRLMDIPIGRMFCKPLVDFNGDVHLSESWLCPSFGNVNTDSMFEIFKSLQESTPCGKCKLFGKFMSRAESDFQLKKAKEIIYSK